jgi:hypothetical protein
MGMYRSVLTNVSTLPKNVISFQKVSDISGAIFISEAYPHLRSIQDAQYCDHDWFSLLRTSTQLWMRKVSYIYTYLCFSSL